MRAFLGYGLEESTPDHSSLSVIRQRLGPEIYQGVFEVVLTALKAHGLFKGRHLGIDSSVIEANASLRTLVHRNTEQAYWEYVKELAEKEGVDPQDEAAVRRFDKNRPGRRTSNEEWKNPHDPQAKVGRTKDGACAMIYKPEHVTDLESGTIVQAEVLKGDHADTKALTERVACAVEVVNRIVANDEDAVVRSLTADKGYFAIEEIAQIQEFDIRTVIGDVHAARGRKEALTAPLRKALHRAASALKSQSGKALLRKRGMHLERSFEHVLDEGGLRRATLRGTENLTKRHKIAAACFNLSLLLRTLLGVGTPKQWAAASTACLRLLSRISSGQYGYFALFASQPKISSPTFLSSSKSHSLHETTGLFNSLLTEWASSGGAAARTLKDTRKPRNWVSQEGRLNASRIQRFISFCSVRIQAPQAYYRSPVL